MNTIPFFQLGIPIPYKGICTIYPLTIKQRMLFDEQYFNKVFIPYTISDDVAQEKLGKADVLSLIMTDDAVLAALCESIKILCDADKIQVDRADSKIFINESKTPLDSAAFREFSKIVRDWNCIPIFKPEPEPVFKTEEGRKQWLKLKECRAKKAKVEDDFLSAMINIVQFGGNSYIDESVIMKWSYWKLVDAYHAVFNSRDYEHSYYAFWKNGQKELLRQTWMERLKPKS